MRTLLSQVTEASGEGGRAASCSAAQARARGAAVASHQRAAGGLHERGQAYEKGRHDAEKAGHEHADEQHKGQDGLGLLALVPWGGGEWVVTRGHAFGSRRAPLQDVLRVRRAPAGTDSPLGPPPANLGILRPSASRWSSPPAAAAPLGPWCVWRYAAGGAAVGAASGASGRGESGWGQALGARQGCPWRHPVTRHARMICGARARWARRVRGVGAPCAQRCRRRRFAALRRAGGMLARRRRRAHRGGMREPGGRRGRCGARPAGARRRRARAGPQRRGAWARGSAR
jgi:hypothetical protein